MKVFFFCDKTLFLCLVYIYIVKYKFPCSSFETQFIFPIIIYVTGELHMGGQKYFYMERNRVLVIPRVEDKEMAMYVSTQNAPDVQVKQSINGGFNAHMGHSLKNWTP